MNNQPPQPPATPKPAPKDLKSELLPLAIPLLLGMASGAFIALGLSSNYNAKLLKREALQVGLNLEDLKNVGTSSAEFNVKTQAFKKGEDIVILQVLSPKEK